MSRSATSALTAQKSGSAQRQPAVSELHVIRGSANHTVQFYETDDYLLHKVTEFISAGIRTGNPAIAIVDREHRAHLGEQFQSEVTSGACQLLDAREILASFMTRGMPNRDRFREVMAGMLELTRPAAPLGKLRVFGEMVDILWKDGRKDAAVALETLWDEAVSEQSFVLLCSCFIGHFDAESDTDRFSRLCQSHGHVLPTERFSGQSLSQIQAREVTRLQHRARALETELEKKRHLEESLRDALRERDRVEAELRVSLEREKHARTTSEASDAFKEMFLSTLGHDLLNPLHTILTTSRLMKMRQELPEGSQARLARIISSGERMQCMIQQIHDLTRARLTSGLAISREKQHDLRAVIAGTVEELRTRNPTRRIVLQGDPFCNAFIDRARIEQVVSNLIGNAIAHGDPERPIHVTLAATDTSATLSVHNFGPSIEPDLVPVLFEPFGHERKMRGHSAGLGLGLYISERIVAAHGGTLEVASSNDAGTCFRVTLPLR